MGKKLSVGYSTSVLAFVDGQCSEWWIHVHDELIYIPYPFQIDFARSPSVISQYVYHITGDKSWTPEDEWNGIKNVLQYTVNTTIGSGQK